jgi:hypothetical protein
MRRSTYFGAGLAILLVQGRASGQPTSPSKSAEALFREARGLMDAKDYTAACPKFAESQKLEPAPGTLLNLADCYEKNGQTASAWSTFKDASKAAAARNRADWTATANQRAAALEPKLASLAIAVPGPADVAGLHVERDGQVVERPAWGNPVPVDPGPHVLTASATGRKPWTKRVDVAATKNIVIDLPVLDAEPVIAPVVVKKPEPDEKPKVEPDGQSLRIAGYVAAGVGIAGLAVGTFTGLHALSKRSDAEGKCEIYPSRCSPDATAANDEAQKFATISTISLVAGGVLVVGGLVLVLIAPKKADVRAALPFVLGGTF